MSFDKRRYPEFVSIHGHPFSRFNGTPHFDDQDDNPRDEGSPLLLVVHDGQGGKRSHTQADLKEGGSNGILHATPSKASPPSPMKTPDQRELDRLREQNRLAEINAFSRVVEKKSAHHPRTLQLLDEAKAAGRTLDQVWDEVCNAIKAEGAEWQSIVDAAQNAGKAYRPGRSALTRANG